MREKIIMKKVVCDEEEGIEMREKFMRERERERERKRREKKRKRRKLSDRKRRKLIINERKEVS